MQKGQQPAQGDRLTLLTLSFFCFLRTAVLKGPPASHVSAAAGGAVVAEETSGEEEVPGPALLSKVSAFWSWGDGKSTRGVEAPRPRLPSVPDCPARPLPRRTRAGGSTRLWGRPGPQDRLLREAGQSCLSVAGPSPKWETQT